MEIKKNDFFNVDIIDIGSNGEGICKIENFTIFVQNALLEEKITIKILKINKNYGFGKIVKIIQKSPYRVEPQCEYYGKCGGCNIMHLDYDKQLEIKSSQVQNNLKKIANITDIQVPKTIGMEYPFKYRNKASFPVNYTDCVNIGFYKLRTHSIVNITNCDIQKDANSDVLLAFRKFIAKTNVSIYDENIKIGEIRHIMTRSNKNGDMLVCVVINNTKFNYKKELIEVFLGINNIKTITINYNVKNNNVILGDKTDIIYGDGYIIDTIKNIDFKISTTSFYQINTSQMEVLYDIALEFCELKGNEIVLDAYCGIGTISLLLSKKCSRVYGVEISKQAIQDANENAQNNLVENVSFLQGLAENILPKLIFEDKISFDVILLDPPRKGCEIAMLDAIVKSNTKKIVYISCNNTTLARDIEYLKQYGYKLQNIQPVDMFCMSMHVETVALLSKLDVDKHIDVEIKLDELDLTSAESKATYAQIKEYILEKFGLKVPTLYIAQIKKKCGIALRENYNKSKKENQIIPQCTPEKEEAIMDALRHFKMI